MKTFQWLPKTTGQYVIPAGFILNLCANALHYIFFSNVDPFIMADSKSIVEWSLRLLRDIGLTLGLSGMVVVGIRILRNDGFSLKKFIMPAVGFLIMVSMAIIGFYTSAMLNSTFEQLEFPSTHAEKYYKEKINDKNISMAERSKYSKYYAKVKYHEEGTIIEYLTPDGAAVAYQPSEQQIKNIEEIREGKIKIKWAQDSLKKSGLLWVTVAIGSVLLGFFTNRRKEHLTTASTADA